MKNTWTKWIAAIMVALMMATMPIQLFAANGQLEHIRSFHSDIVVNKDGTLHVTETITIDCNHNKVNRGMIRNIPTNYHDKDKNIVQVDIEVNRVLRNGQPEPYSVSKTSKGIDIALGTNEKLPKGQHTYTIEYTLNSPVSHFDNHDEIYWNVTGNKNSFTIDTASVKITLPEEVSIEHSDGYTGHYGSREDNFVVVEKTTNTITMKTTRPLRPYQGFTTVVGFTKGVVKIVPLKQIGQYQNGFGPPLPYPNNEFIFLAQCLMLGGLMLVLYRSSDKAKRVIVPQYKTLKNLSGAEMRYLLMQNVDIKGVSSLIVDLAQMGYLTIEQESGHAVFKLVKRDKDPKGLQGVHQAAYQALFVDADTFKLTRSNHKRMIELFKAASNSMDKTLAAYQYKHKRLDQVVYGIFLGLVGLYALSVDTDMLFLFALIAMFGFSFTKMPRLSETRDNSIWGKLKSRLGFLLVAVSISVAFYRYGFFDFGPYFIILFGGVISACYRGSLLIPNDALQEAFAHIHGFKDYLSKTEVDLSDYETKITPDLYDKNLSYAIALDVEKAWFKKINKALEGTLMSTYNPGWYHGYYSNNWSSSAYTGFSNSFCSAVQSAGRAPSANSGYRNGGFGGGGFSGGGFSGGGFGGGGCSGR